MANVMTDILYQVMLPLLAAHMAGDFILQSNNDVKNKKKYKVFFKHIALLTILSYVLTGLWSDYIIPVTILVSHTIIDLVKRSFSKDSIILFVTDQAAHIIIILLLSFYMQEIITEEGYYTTYWYELLGAIYLKVMLLITAFILTSKVGSILVSYIIKPLQIKDYVDGISDAQINTGRLVGLLE